jgi:hypothetical protein
MSRSLHICGEATDSRRPGFGTRLRGGREWNSALRQWEWN